MSSSDGKVNYAHALGIHSVAAAAIFAALYLILLPFFVVKTTRNPVYIFILLTLFCAIRVAAFVIRAVLAGSDTAGENLGLYIGAQITYSVGFFGLIYSAYSLILDRELLGGHWSNTPISRLLSSRHLVHFILSGAVAIGIVGATQTSTTNASDQHLSNVLRRVSNIIFLVVTLVLLLHTLYLVRRGVGAPKNDTSQAIGAVHGMKIIFVILVCFIIRMSYLIATVGKVQHESEWYPFAALTEFLAVSLFATPYLVPYKSEMVAYREQYAKGGTSSPTEMA